VCVGGGAQAQGVRPTSGANRWGGVQDGEGSTPSNTRAGGGPDSGFVDRRTFMISSVLSRSPILAVIICTAGAASKAKTESQAAMLSSSTCQPGANAGCARWACHPRGLPMNL
jgi:hypothetical protein